MPLQLVTGPANSAKAGEVLGGYRERLDEAPLLVVPAYRDVEHAQREMARHGAVFGTRVIRFAWLFDEIASRAGYVARKASRVQRRVVLEDAVAGAGLEALGASAAQAGFVSAAGRFIAELERNMVEPAVLAGAVARWRGAPPHAGEAARVYAAYAEGMERVGLVSEEAFGWRAIEALRAEPARFGASPVFLYGFDDFTPIELRAIETLAGPAGSDVVVSLPYEIGRDAFRALAGTFEDLRRFADGHTELPPLSDHYSDAARPALHHLERTLFAPVGVRADPGGAVRLQSAGGRRAEVELAGAAVLELLGEGVPAGEVAVVARDPARYGTLFDQVFGSYGIPFSSESHVPLARTPLGRGLLALLRCAGACPAPAAVDLLAYLRTPGRLTQPGLADRLERELRRQGARTLAQARAEWDEEKVPLDELDELAAADGKRLVERLERAVERLFAGPYTRRAHVFAPEELDDPRVFAAVREALAGLRALGDRVRLDAARLHSLLEDVEVRLGEPPQPDRVHVTKPEEIRARRFSAVLVLGLQEGEFPRPGRPEPFLPDEDRRELARASGLVLPPREDELDRERYLFYVCASRAERRLLLSWRTSDEQGGPEAESFFLDDVRDVLALPARPHRVRDLADVTWALPDAPTRVEWERSAAATLPPEEAPSPDGLRSAEVLEALAARESWSASALELAADCPVKWLVERLIDPEALEPDAEQLVRGSFAHEVLRLVFERLGGEQLTPERLPAAERHLMDAIRSLQDSFPISPDKSRVRAAVRKLEFDLLRYLQDEAARDDDFRPAEFEREFSVAVDGVSVRGRIDRVDVCGDWRLVRDYKTGARAHPVARWTEDRRLQVAVYLLALRGLEPDARLAGGVYQALASKDMRPRGLLNSEAADVLGGGWYDNDFRDADGFDAVLGEVQAIVEDLVRRLRAGQIAPCPETCAYRGGCSHPAICRREG